MNNKKNTFIILSEKRYRDPITKKLVRIETIKVDKKFYDFCKNFKKDTWQITLIMLYLYQQKERGKKNDSKRICKLG